MTNQISNVYVESLLVEEKMPNFKNKIYNFVLKWKKKCDLWIKCTLGVWIWHELKPNEVVGQT